MQTLSRDWNKDSIQYHVKFSIHFELKSMTIKTLSQNISGVELVNEYDMGQ